MKPKDEALTSTTDARSDRSEATNNVPMSIQSESEPETTAKTVPVTDGLRSAVNDAKVMQLVKSYKSQCLFTEEYALNYISDLHHPVISCFRELRKSDFHTLFGTNKLKRHIPEPVEQSIIYLGMIDYIATASNNPLYEDNFNKKSFSKSALLSVRKIMMEFKSIFGNWALSDKSIVRQRYDVIMSHLRRLVPLFDASGIDFGMTLDCVESDLVRIKSNQDRIKLSFSEDTKEGNRMSCDSTQEERLALGEIILNFDPNFLSDEDQLPSESPALPISKKTSGWNSTPNILKNTAKAKVTAKKQRSSGNSVSTMISSIGSKTHSKSMASFLQSVDSSSTANSSKRSIPDSISPLTSEQPSKKAKTTTNISALKSTAADSKYSETSVFSTSPNKNKSVASPAVNEVKKINAFAVLMNKSREIAQANKLKKLAALAKTSRIAVEH